MKKLITILLTIILLISSASFVHSDNNKLEIPSLSKLEALNIARSYIASNDFAISKELDLNKEYSINYNKSAPFGYNITFNRVINNIPYGTDNINVFIDGVSGKVLSYYKNFSSNLKLDDSTSFIDIKTAEEKFRNSMGLELTYNKYISNKKIVAYLTYTAKEDLVINAHTGNIIPITYDIPENGYFDIAHMSEKTSGTAYSDSSLSTADADAIARNIPEFGITDKYSPVSANYLRSQDGTYLISITYSSGSSFKTITLNATTGVPVEYESNSAQLTQKNPSEQTKRINDFVNRYYSNYLESTIKLQNITDEHTITLYERQVNGIPYKSNGLYVCFDNYGNLKNLSFAWDNIEFPGVDNIMTLDMAYDEFFKKCGLELSYHKRGTNELTPVYKISSTGTGIFDAKKGTQLNYDGTGFNKERNFNYLDTNSHYASYAASKLYDCDIYVSSGNVYLKDFITQKEFLLLISELITGTKPILSTTGILSADQLEMLYTYMIENNVIDKSEIDINGYVTRENAVKYLLRILGYGDVADASEIFIPHFSDANAISENSMGYVELARGMGIVKGDNNNAFRPKDFLSNGDSLIMIYNYLG